jgi:hypothetical protein
MSVYESQRHGDEDQHKGQRAMFSAQLHSGIAPRERFGIGAVAHVYHRVITLLDSIGQQPRQRGNAVNYAVRGQDAAGLAFGTWRQTQPPRLADDIAALAQRPPTKMRESAGNLNDSAAFQTGDRRVSRSQLRAHFISGKSPSSFAVCLALSDVDRHLTRTRTPSP